MRPIDYLLDTLAMIAMLAILYGFLIFGAAIEGGAL